LKRSREIEKEALSSIINELVVILTFSFSYLPTNTAVGTKDLIKLKETL
jgi:hypothetical protein